MTAGFHPIEGKRVVSKLSVCPDLDIEQLAKVVGVKLKQIRQDRRLCRRGRKHFDLWGRFG
jgi:hypothetical protein